MAIDDAIEDDETVRRAFEDLDEEAFEQIVKWLVPRLRGTARRLLVVQSSALVDDLVQDTLERLTIARQKALIEVDRGCRGLSGWATRVLTHRFIDLYRQGRAYPLEALEQDEGPGEDGDRRDVVMQRAAGGHRSAEDLADLRADLRRALQGLDVVKRALVVLVDYQGYTVREAAASLGLKESNAHDHIKRARTQLRAELLCHRSHGLDRERPDPRRPPRPSGQEQDTMSRGGRAE